ncbi:MAG: alpha/beta hydrolase, partial [Flavobacteriaceae bacterium]
RALFGTFKVCEEDPNCNNQYPDLKNEFLNAMEKLEAEPYEFSYNGAPWVMNVQDFLLVLHQLLYRKETIGQIPSVITAITTENEEVLRGALGPTVAVANLINIAMYLSVNAYDELPFNDEDSLMTDLEANPEIPEVPAFFGSDPKLLQEWHPYRAEAYENARVVSSIPTLIFNGSLDPITPPVNAEKAASGLSNSYYMLFKNEGHSFFSPCFFEISKAFLDQPEQRPDSDCLSSLPQIPWN